MSRPRELPLQPLVEPYVNLSTYTAPLIKPCHTAAASGQTGLAPDVTLWRASDNSGVCACAASWTSAVPIQRESGRNGRTPFTLRSGRNCRSTATILLKSHRSRSRTCEESHRLARQMPLRDPLPHPCLGLTAGAGQETRKELPRPILYPPRPKGKAEEGKLNRGIVAPAIAVLAVDNAHLVRMQLQPVLPQAGGEAVLHLLCLPLRAAMPRPIIRRARNRARRQLPSQPTIQGMG